MQERIRVLDREIEQWVAEAPFHHNPLITDFRKYFQRSEWKETIDNLKGSGVSNLLVSSGSGFRNVASYVLSDELGVSCTAVGKIEDELKLERFQQATGSDDIVEYQSAVSRSKFLREEFLANGELKEGSLILAMDEFVMVWEDGNLRSFEKPASEAEAIKQIWTLTSGVRYIVSNTSRVGTARTMQNGKMGVATHLLPMRVVCKNSKEREKLFDHWVGLYRAARDKKIPWKVTPAGISLLHPDLQPYQEIRVSEPLSAGVLPAGFSRPDFLKTMGENRFERSIKPNRAYLKFADSLLKGSYGVPYLHLPPELKEEVGIAVGGLSLVGLREACNRYLTMKEWGVGGDGDQYTAFFQMVAAPMNLLNSETDR